MDQSGPVFCSCSVEEISCVPDIINPLSVSTSSPGKQRLILALRYVNAFIYKQNFNCEDLSVASQIFDKDCYLFEFDLKSGYRHIEILPEVQILSILRSSVWLFFCFFFIFFIYLFIFH